MLGIPHHPGLELLLGGFVPPAPAIPGHAVRPPGPELQRSAQLELAPVPTFQQGHLGEYRGVALVFTVLLEVSKGLGEIS